jgi:hypothetical protein
LPQHAVDIDGLFHRPKHQLGVREVTSGEVLQTGPAHCDRLGRQLGLAFPQQIECEEHCRRFLRQFLHAARSRMDALQQIIERKLAARRNDDFADKSRRRTSSEWFEYPAFRV